MKKEPQRKTIDIVGWDVGGVNVKACRLSLKQDCLRQVRVISRPFEIWRDKDLLPELLGKILDDMAPNKPPRAMAVTMSAELSDVFATKREGVQFVLKCFQTRFPEYDSCVLNVSGQFVPLNEARKRPLEFAATNWMASALWLARKHPDCLLVDVGSTTTDILPILKGKVYVGGRTDTDRLLRGELVYTGVLRTHLATIVQSVPVSGRFCRVASEYFAVSGDVHLILGYLQPEDYTCPTPDNRPPTVNSARMRLARLICADTESLSIPEIDALARYIHKRQIQQIRSGLEQVITALPEMRECPVMVFGAGAFLGIEAAEALGLRVRDMKDSFSSEESAALPCLAAAHLLAAQNKEEA